MGCCCGGVLDGLGCIIVAKHCSRCHSKLSQECSAHYINKPTSFSPPPPPFDTNVNLVLLHPSIISLSKDYCFCTRPRITENVTLPGKKKMWKMWKMWYLHWRQCRRHWLNQPENRMLFFNYVKIALIKCGFGRFYMGFGR